MLEWLAASESRLACGIQTSSSWQRAFGSGLRLRNPNPLTPLADACSILRQQLDNVHSDFGDRARVTIVVGLKYHLVMEEAHRLGPLRQRRQERSGGQHRCLGAGEVKDTLGGAGRIELAIEHDDLVVWPVDVLTVYAIEVDTAGDLALARVAAADRSQADAAAAAGRAPGCVRRPADNRSRRASLSASPTLTIGTT
ncbi:MAG TPA: hypothetical protein VES01_05525 [Dermatophilaceae bacterium]|nr:hypothetical protein [Dermatophilaceae bacterium]